MARDGAAVAAGPRSPTPTTGRTEAPRDGGGIFRAIITGGLILAAAGGRSAASEGGPLPWPVVVTQLPAGTAAEKQGPRASGMLRADYGDGARLVVVAPGGGVRVLSAGFHSAGEADVSWDGRRVVFAGKKAAGDRWNVFEVGLDGSGLRQVTRDLGDCRSPRYLSSFYTITENEPWDQVAFVVTGRGRTNEFGGDAPTALYTAKLDGTFVQRITYNLSGDQDPAVARDGRLLFATWHRATLDDGLTGRVALEGINTDGSDRAAYAPRNGRRVQHMPCETAGGLAVFVESDGLPWDGAGTLASVSVRRPLHTYRALTKPADGLFHSPSALPDGRVLVACRPADGSGTLGVVALDPASGRRVPVFDDPGYHEMYARAAAPRPRADGRSSVVAEVDPTAKLYCQNVFTTEFKDRSWFPRGSAKAVRVIEGLPPAGPAEVSEGAVPALSPRRVLAEVPLAGDGSFHLVVPANTPVQLQVVDDKGLALRSCGWIWARSHQAQGCIGCHEDPERTPDNVVPKSLFQPGVSVAVKDESKAAVDFRRDVAPLVAARCATCHGPGGSAPRLAGAGAESARQAYDALMARDPDAPPGAVRGRYVQPGQARTSPLVWHVLGRNAARPWDADAAARPAKPIPQDDSGRLTDEEVRTLVRWVDLGASWDVPAPPPRGAAGSK